MHNSYQVSECWEPLQQLTFKLLVYALDARICSFLEIKRKFLPECGGLVTLSNGSVGVPEGMPSGEACIWVISLPRSGANNSTNIIEFTLTHPKVSSNSSLWVWYIQVFFRNSLLFRGHLSLFLVLSYVRKGWVRNNNYNTVMLKHLHHLSLKF